MGLLPINIMKREVGFMIENMKRQPRKNQHRYWCALDELNHVYCALTYLHDDLLVKYHDKIRNATRKMNKSVYRSVRLFTLSNLIHPSIIDKISNREEYTKIMEEVNNFLNKVKIMMDNLGIVDDETEYFSNRFQTLEYKYGLLTNLIVEQELYDKDSLNIS